MNEENGEYLLLKSNNKTNSGLNKKKKEISDSYELWKMGRRLAELETSRKTENSKLAISLPKIEKNLERN